jgi:hypothetical protein
MTGHDHTGGLGEEKRGKGERSGPFSNGQLFSEAPSLLPPSCTARRSSICGLLDFTMSTANFASELESALKENSFGLKDYQVTQETQLQSIATVVLLEGNVVTVSLSPRGFLVSS